MSMMHKMESTQDEDLEDFLMIVEKNISLYFVEIENSVPHFQQTLFDLQNECFKAWKNVVSINMSLQKGFVSKTGNAICIPRETQIIIDVVNGEFAKIRSKQNKTIIVSIESMKKNVMAYNNSLNIFGDLNQSMMNYWISMFAPK